MSHKCGYSILKHLLLKPQTKYVTTLPPLHHYSETAVVEVLDDGDLTMLTLLDLSAVFGTVDHDIGATSENVIRSSRLCLDMVHDLCHLCPRLYADDTQIYCSCNRWMPPLFVRMSTCVDEVASWMLGNRLQLNTSKTEMLWCATNQRQHQMPHEPTRVGNDSVQSASSVRDLGIYLDYEASIIDY